MIKTKLITIILMFCLLVTLVSAVNPIVSIDTPKAHIEILSPRIEYFSIKTAFQLHFAPYNSSVAPLSNDSVDCSGELFTSENDFFAGKLFNDGNYKWVFNVSNDLINETGEVEWWVKCNSTEGEYGASTGGIIMTSDGSNPANNDNFLPLIIAVFIVVWLAIKLMFNLDTDHILLKLFFSIMAVLFTYGGLALALSLAVANGMSAIVINGVTTVYNTFTVVLYLYFAYIIVYFIYRIFKYQSEEKYN